jgi:hypothetical protein
VTFVLDREEVAQSGVLDIAVRCGSITCSGARWRVTRSRTVAVKRSGDGRPSSVLLHTGIAWNSHRQASEIRR